MQEQSLVAWHPHPFCTSVDLSQAAGCSYITVSSLLQYMYLVLLLRFIFIFLIRQSLIFRNCTCINLLHGRKKETGYDLPKILPPLFLPTQYRTSQSCICLVNFVLFEKVSSFILVQLTWTVDNDISELSGFGLMVFKSKATAYLFFALVEGF